MARHSYKLIDQYGNDVGKTPAKGQSNITLIEIFDQAYQNGLEAGGIGYAQALKRVERRLKRIERKL